MYTNEDAALFQRMAVDLNLKYPACFNEMQPEVLAGIINGYGPDCWCEEIRKILSLIFRKYPVPAAIHDVRYEFSDGRELTRRAADAEFAANLRLVWRYNYGVWRFINPVAWYDLLKIKSAVFLTFNFGSKAWRNAFLRKQGETGNE